MKVRLHFVYIVKSYFISVQEKSENERHEAKDVAKW